MHHTLIAKLSSLWSIKKEFRLKVSYLTLTFLFMSACLVIWRPLKLAVFSKIVGAYLVPDAKLYSLCVLIPLILIYSKLVDWLRRHQLLYCFMIFHALGGIIFYLLLSHPVHGLANTEVNPNRLVGWAFYFFMESFDAFFSTVFWSFADSVNTPKDAKNFYGIFVSGSKIGGIIAAGFLYLVISHTTTSEQLLLLPAALLVGCSMLLAAASCIYLLVKDVSDNFMHGYESAYQLETHKEAETKTVWQSMKSSVDGLVLIIKNPYVLGIFSLVLFYEIMIVMIEYRVAINADAAHSTVGGLTGFYALYYLLMNAIGLIISLFGTTPLLRFFGIRASLFAFPLLCLGILLVTFVFPTEGIIFALFVGLRAFNYALNHPTREVLYIPTTKDIKFKAKTWTDAFGSRIAKSCGSIINVSLKGLPQSFALCSTLLLSISFSSLWLIIVYFLGRTLQYAVDNKKVIGDDAAVSEESIDAKEF
ncbi:hypothetical protein JST56_01340 [Candidatus Dependentiae bacterium]|nr:hypothetical protein [Candidatus Dependentiae bacterium]